MNSRAAFSHFKQRISVSKDSANIHVLDNILLSGLVRSAHLTRHNALSRRTRTHTIELVVKGVVDFTKIPK